MKLNFWQILGIIAIVVALIGIGYRELGKTSSTTQPATQTKTP